MKIQTESHAPAFSKSARGSASDGAFDQTLRALEREMWSGAAAGDTQTCAIKTAPLTFEPRSKYPDTISGNGESHAVFRANSGARASARFAGAWQPEANRAAVEAPLFADRVHADECVPPAAWSSIRPDHEHERAPQLSDDNDKRNTTFFPKRPHEERPSPCAETRKTVHIGDEGVQLVMRVQIASHDEAQAIARHAADSLRRRVFAPVRVIVNGAEAEERNAHPSLYPVSHGEFHGN